MRLDSIIYLLLILLFTQCKNEEARQISNIKIDSAHQHMEYKATYDLEFLMGQFDPKVREGFIEIDEKYADRKGRLMKKEAFHAFKRMADDAKSYGHKMIIVSATRNFDYQKGIWERKWNGSTLLGGKIKATDIPNEVDRAKEIMKYSAMPGTSRHHWGTDIDINAFTNSYFENGKGLALFDWMEQHAHEYGFARPYTSKNKGRTGYEEEKWHWTYLPLSMLMTKDMQATFKDSLLDGFDGSTVGPELSVLDKYILGISRQCK